MENSKIVKIGASAATLGFGVMSLIGAHSFVTEASSAHQEATSTADASESERLQLYSEGQTRDAVGLILFGGADVVASVLIASSAYRNRRSKPQEEVIARSN